MSTPAAPSAPSSPSGSAPKPAAGQAPQSAPNKPANPTGKQGPAATQAQPAAGPSQQPSKPQERILKVKVDGQLVEMSESEVLELASAGRASNQRFQEAAKLRRDAEAIMKAADENPAEFMSKRGKDTRKWAEEFLINELKKESETPEQKKSRENEEELRRYKDKEKADEQGRKDAEMAQAISEQREKYDKLFTAALFESGLPRTPFTVRRMAELQKINIKKKLELSAPQLAKLVREDYIAEQKSLMGSLEGDGLLEFLGPDLVKKLSKAQIAKLKARGNGGQGAGSSNSAAPKSTTKDKAGMTWKEYQRRNRRIG